MTNNNFMYFGSHKIKQLCIGLLLALFLFGDIFGVSLLRPGVVHAQANAAAGAAKAAANAAGNAGIPVNVVGDQPAAARSIWDDILAALTASSLGALVNGVSYFTRKLAYDTAVYVASGGSGQGSLVFEKGFGEYLEGVALNSAASAIEQFGEPLGLNLCAPPDLRLMPYLQMGFSSIYGSQSGGGGGPKPRCKWNDLKSNWNQIDEMYGSRDALSQRFAVAIDVKESDFGIALGGLAQIDNLVFKAQEGADKERLEGAGFKAVTDLISGYIKTPAGLVKEEAKSVTAKNQGELSATQIAGIYGSGALEILPAAAGVFLNTLTSELLKKLLTVGLTSGDGESPITEVLNEYASVVNYNRLAAEKAFSYLLTGVPIRSLTAYNIIAEFNACPDNPTINNCIMDDGMVRALERSRQGEPLTIEEAMDAGMLHADWFLISADRKVDNTNLSYCHNNAYCYSNLQKLRKVRILPLGFEIAAARSPMDNPVTLGQVVAEFSNCGEGAVSPYCHLIDPNWLLIEPDARCDAEVTGEELLASNLPERKRACVDISTCLTQRADGSCDSYGYCTKEKNIWVLPGLGCPAYYNTCRTFTGEDGSTSSYLTRTLDFGTCDANSVGCRAYSAETIDGEWVSTPELLDISGELTSLALAKKEEGRAQTIHFNDNIEQYSCQNGPEVEGCNAFYRATDFIDGGEELGRGPIYLKKAPDYLGCYDVNPATLEIDWPKTRADLYTLASNENRSEEVCSNFAQTCIAEEVGCDAYTPSDGRPEVTGIVGENICPARCVGYDTFKQEGGTPETAAFEPPQFPVYFIPGDGDKCAPQYVGCDEFTNIDEVAKGGEGLEYYREVKYCERPDGINEKAFYSWEGSENEGYVLKKHRMLQIDDEEFVYLSSIGLSLTDEIDDESYSQLVRDVFSVGSPAYANDTKSALELNYELCNERNHGVLVNDKRHPDRAHDDCRALYDSGGNVYYRILDDTVTVSDACQPLRKTLSNLYEDGDLTSAGQDNCESKGGLWDLGVCKRCYGGGSYSDGSCVYWAIPSESQSCPASANGCRLYTGNTGTDLEKIFFADFEPFGTDDNALLEARAGWIAPASGDTISIELESTQVGGRSLKVERGLEYQFDYGPGSLESGSWYQLSFWTRGVPQSLSIMFGNSAGVESGNFTYDPARGQDAPISVRDEWQEYLLGPIQYTGDSPDGATLMFIRSLAGGTAGSYFIDNVRLTRMEERIPLIKNSWKTPEGYDVPYLAGDWYNTCDEDPTDGLPGSHLGCKEYTRRDGERVTLTGLERLCRREAVGCTPLYDTYNTLETDFADEYDEQVFNLWCESGEEPLFYAPEGSSCEEECTIAQTTSCQQYCSGFGNADFDKRECIVDNFCDEDDEDCIAACYFPRCESYCAANNEEYQTCNEGCVDQTCMDNYNSCAAQYETCIENFATPAEYLAWYDRCMAGLIEGYEPTHAACSAPYEACQSLPNCTEEYGTQGSSCINQQCQTDCSSEYIQGCVTTCEQKSKPKVEGVVAQNCMAVCGDSSQSGKCQLLSSSYSVLGDCSVPKGKTGCYVDNFSVPAGTDVSSISNGRITESTVIIPADTPSDSPIYLTHYDDYICNEVDRGCQSLGLQSLNSPDVTEASSYTFETKYFKNDPARYMGINGTLCNSDLVGCGEFTSDSGTRFFKDPRLVSPALCTYQTITDTLGVSQSGWFMDGIGICAGSSDFCKSDDECGEGIVCSGIGIQPCYPNYDLSGTGYGLWSNDSINYKGFVGTCTAESNGCTELRDPADTSTSPDGELYYALYNNDLFANIQECDGKASQKHGCVLFDMTENPNKVFNSRQTYENSKKKEKDTYGLVDIIKEPSVSLNASIGTLDTNVLLKVDRSRACGEWLYCESSMTVLNKQGQEQEVCSNYFACKDKNKDGVCIPAEAEDIEGRLTEATYKNRDISWSGVEYSGYSLFNKYHVSNYAYVSVGDGEDSFLGYELKSAQDECGLGDGGQCGSDNGGRCYDGKCLYPIDGVFPSSANTIIDDVQKYLEPRACKMYPETNSPYDPTLALVKDGIKKNSPEDNSVWRKDVVDQGQNFGQANICQEGDCSCEYYKVEYKNVPKADYWPITYNRQNIPAGVCVGGENEAAVSMDGYPCETNGDCGTTGICARKDKQGEYRGLYGFCLEFDYSRKIGVRRVDANRTEDVFACLTWLPIQESVSGIDVYNSDPRTGYYPFCSSSQCDDADDGGGVYCLRSSSVPGGENNDDRALGHTDPFESWIYRLSYSGDSPMTEDGSYTVDLDLSPYIANGVPGDGNGYYDFIFFTGLDPDTYDPRQDRTTPYHETEEEEGVPQLCSGELFDVKSVWDYVQERNRITDVDFSPYQVLMCGEGWVNPDAMRNKQVQVLGWWGLKNVGHSAKLLRMDIKNGYDETYIDVDETSKIYTPFTFAPEVESAGGQEAVEVGVLMHPPRVWSNLPVGSRYRVNADPFVSGKAYEAEQASAPIATDGWKIDTTLMSADKIYSSQTAQNYVWKSDIESSLRDSYLNSVYFVPLAYPGGMEGNSPVVLDTSFNIPIGDLRMGNQNAVRDTANIKTGLRSVRSNGDFYLITNSDDPEKGDLNQLGGLYSYVLDKEKGDNLLSFGTYDSGGAAPSGAVWNTYQALSDDQKERSEVSRRYVSVFFDASHAPEFIDNLAPSPDNERPPDADNDPFMAACKHDNKVTPNEEDEHNWIAIGMDFNKDGEFIGYISRWCNGWENGSGEAHAIRFAVFGLFKEYCEIYAGVYDAFEDALNTNKAWTDRVWQYSFLDIAPSGPTGPLPSGPFDWIRHDTPLRPFGSISLEGADLRSSDNAKLYNYVFDDKNLDGMPWSCTNTVGGCSGLLYANTNDDENGQYDLSNQLDSRMREMGMLLGDSPRVDRYILYLFAKYYSYNINTGETDTPDASGVVSLDDYTHKPPQILALNTIACGLGGDTCVAGELNNVTINMRNGTYSDFDGDLHADEDFDSDDRIDPIIGDGSSVVDLRFFAFADNNHMPIKRVLVDWGDGDRTPDREGFYKNRKPFCESADSGGQATVGRCTPTSESGGYPSDAGSYGHLITQLTCSQDSDCQFLPTAALTGSSYDRYKCVVYGTRHFGDSARACEAGYFRYSKLYTCTQEMVNSRASYVKSVGELASDEAKEELQAMGVSQVCVFKPKVQVLDNWGWCNGDCGQGADKGCWNDGTFKLCGDLNYGSYTEYKGEIIVIPR